MQFVNGQMSVPSLLVFGPQTSWPTSEYLAQLRVILLSEPSLADLLSSIKGLPKLWHELVQSDPDLSHIISADHLDALIKWIEYGTYPVSFDSANPNIISMPFTVILHLIQYVHYLDSNLQVSNHAQSLTAARTGGFQGFCVGFLSAVALGCARNEETIGRLGGIALRLAFCIGAYVDLDMVIRGETSVLAIRWYSREGPDLVIHSMKRHQDVRHPIYA
jgi:hypothetical protein